MYITSNEYWMLGGITVLKAMGKKRLANALKLVSAEIDEYCNTRFEPTEDVYTLDVCERFYTRRRPLLEVSGLFLRGEPLVLGRDYFVYPESAKVETCGFGSGRMALEIKYLYGYREVPATVKKVVVELMRLDAESSAVPYNGMQSESWENEYSYTRGMSKDLTPAELRKNILSRLDCFKVPPYTEPIPKREVRARVI